MTTTATPTTLAPTTPPQRPPDNPPDGDRHRQTHPLIDALRRLEETRDRATLAKLRRGVGKPLGLCAERDGWTLRHFRDDAPRHELERAALVAGLFALHPTPGGRGGLGAAMKRGKRGEDDDATERRFVVLLNSDAADLPHRLRQVVTLLASRDVPIDWNRLLRDLRHWNADSRWVQIQWSQEFWSKSRPENTADD